MLPGSGIRVRVLWRNLSGSPGVGGKKNSGRRFLKLLQCAAGDSLRILPCQSFLIWPTWVILVNWQNSCVSFKNSQNVFCLDAAASGSLIICVEWEEAEPKVIPNEEAANTWGFFFFLSEVWNSLKKRINNKWEVIYISFSLKKKKIALHKTRALDFLGHFFFGV